MIEWYRSRLTPSYTEDLDKIEHNILFANRRILKATPSIWPTPLIWTALLFTLASSAIGGIIAIIRERDGEETAALVFGTPVVINIAAAFFILPIKGIAFVFWETGKYIPWHYGFFLGYFVIPILIILLLVGAFFLDATNFLKKTAKKINIERVAKSEKRKIASLSTQSQIKENISIIMENVDLLTGNEEEDTAILMQISDSFSSLKYDPDFAKHKDNIRSEFEIVLEKLNELGYGSKAITKRLTKL